MSQVQKIQEERDGFGAALKTGICRIASHLLKKQGLTLDDLDLCIKTQFMESGDGKFFAFDVEGPVIREQTTGFKSFLANNEKLKSDIKYPEEFTKFAAWSFDSMHSQHMESVLKRTIHLIGAIQARLNSTNVTVSELFRGLDGFENTFSARTREDLLSTVNNLMDLLDMPKDQRITIEKGRTNV